jgi:tRNA modification GTPase
VTATKFAMKDLGDTICALSTAPGRSGMAVVRLSGPLSFSLISQVFRTKNLFKRLPPRRAMLGLIVNPSDGSAIDEGIATCFPSPHSYTGEDMTEFSLHGSPILIATLLDCLCSLGARLAEPGEFTLRAFLHGRIDLAQAEAIRDVIDATTLYQAQVAGRQRSGALSQHLGPVKDSLITIIVNLESAVEFVEEDLPLSSRETLVRQIEAAQAQLRSWIDSYRRGRIIKDGFSMAVVGRPNTGKSSIFNALLAQNRSIVAEVPGTTRDLVSEFTNLGGIPVRLHDTAGIHHSDDHVERLGIDRSLQAIADADSILLVVDTSRPPSPQDLSLKKQLGDLSCIAVMNKSDLPLQWSSAEMKEFGGDWPYVEVSAKTGSGIEELRSVILDGILGAGAMPRDGMLVTNLRHCHNLEAAEKALARAATALQNGLSEEFALIDLHSGLGSLGAITGDTHVEDLLTEIFSRFCVGK